MSLPAILGAVSGLSGLFGGGGASNVAKQAMTNAQNQQNAIIGRQTDGYDQYRTALYDAIRQGAFDPESQINQSHVDASRAQAGDLKNLAAAMAVAGYSGGDTPLQTQLDGSIERNRANVASQDYAIRQQTLNSMLGAYAGLNSAGGSLNGALQTANQNYQTALGQANQAGAIQGQGLGALVGAVTPFLASRVNPTITNVTAPKVDTGLGGGSGMFGAQGFGSGSLGGMTGLGGGSGMFGNVDQFGSSSKPFNR